MEGVMDSGGWGDVHVKPDPEELRKLRVLGWAQEASKRMRDPKVPDGEKRFIHE
jgi:glycylpeptide N-tetradecanoyltransferase